MCNQGNFLVSILSLDLIQKPDVCFFLNVSVTLKHPKSYVQYFIMSLNNASEVSRTTSRSVSLLCSQESHWNLALIFRVAAVQGRDTHSVGVDDNLYS